MAKGNIKVMLSLVLILLIAAALRIYNLVYFHDLDSDEAVYAQATFALSRGLLPYKEVFLAHPPVYYYLAYPFVLSSPSVYSFRLFNVILSLCTLIVSS